MRLSEVSLEMIKAYGHIDGTAEDDNLITDLIIPSARAYVLEYTGQNEESADDLPDLALACIVLCTYMYDHRDMVVDRSNVNRVIETTLGMHSVNLL